MGKRIVIALGGNALGKTISEQAEVVKGTAKAIAGPDPCRSSGCYFTWKWTSGGYDPEVYDSFA